MKNYSIFILILGLTLTSCGGGGGGGGSSPVPVPTPSNQAPAISSSSTFTAAENQTSIGSVTASDPDGNSLTYSISGSEINISSSGVLTFASAPDYETKNLYTATVTVTDGTLSVTQDIEISVSDVDENTAPTISATSLFIDENVTSVEGLTLSDAEGDTLTVKIEPAASFQPQWVFGDDLVGGLIIGTVDDLDGLEDVTLGNEDGSTLIISENTSFTNEIVKLISNIQLADGVELSFGNRAGIYSVNKDAPYKIEVRNGKFNCNDSRMRGVEILYEETNESPADATGEIFVAGCSWIKGYLARPSGNAVYGKWDLRSTYFEEVNKDSYAYFWYPKGILLSANIFYNSGPMTIGFRSEDIVNGNGSSNITSNIFVRNEDVYLNAPGNCKDTKVYICLWAAYGSRQLALIGNAFLNTNYYAHVDVSDGNTFNMTSDDNYYGVTNIVNVSDRYLDDRDDLSFNAIKLDDVLTYINTNALPNFQPRLIYNSDGSFKLDVPPDYEAKQRTYRYKITFSDGQEEVSEEITLEINDLSD